MGNTKHSVRTGGRLDNDPNHGHVTCHTQPCTAEWRTALIKTVIVLCHGNRATGISLTCVVAATVTSEKPIHHATGHLKKTHYIEPHCDVAPRTRFIVHIIVSK